LSFSIRKKITYGFYLLLTVMVGVAVLTYGIVRQVERKVVFVEVIDDFFNATLEVRRFEKNYFLYRQEKDYQENLLYWQKIYELNQNNAAELQKFVSQVAASRLSEKIADYRNYMQQLHEYNLDKDDKASKKISLQLEDRIRAAGKDLTDFAEKTSFNARTSIKKLLLVIRNVLLFSILFLCILTLAIAALLGRSVVNSLKALEGYTKIISQGEFVEIAVREKEQEIRSLLTAFNRMTKELQMRQQQQLMHSEKLAALGTLLSGVAHELNNPLSNISSSAQILSEEIDAGGTDFNNNLIQQIETQSDKARDIVRTLLEFSRIREFIKQKLPLKKLTEETILLVHGQVPGEVEIAVDIPEGLEILADKQRLQQVFLNLIKNAVDAVSPNGHIWVSARPTQKHPTEGGVEITVEDDGPGIDPETCKHIFDPFFTTKDVGKGSGLGLFVVHDIIEWHGGSITVDSKPGVGTTFVIWLPGNARIKK